MSRPAVLLFPGQGSEQAGMGLALAAASARAAALLDLASSEAGCDLRRLLREGGAALERGSVLQPALVAVSLAAFSALGEAGFEPWAVAGHSLGELSALAAAGSLSLEAAVRVAAARGRAMEREARAHPAGMLAAFAAEEEVSRHLAADPRLELAAANAPGEWVLSGPEEALEAAAKALPSRRLRVSGGWHSRAMEGAAGELRAAVQGARPVPPRLRAYSALTGEPLGAQAALEELLPTQLVRPVRFAALLRRLAADGAELFVAMGCGRTLGALVRQNLPGAAVLRVEEPADVERVLQEAGR